MQGRRCGESQRADVANSHAGADVGWSVSAQMWVSAGADGACPPAIGTGAAQSLDSPWVHRGAAFRAKLESERDAERKMYSRRTQRGDAGFGPLQSIALAGIEVCTLHNRFGCMVEQRVTISL